MPNDRVLHMIGNAHIDPVWLWQWPEGLQEARATFWSAIERMAENPDFVFTCNQVALLAWVEESDPELFARIRKRAAEGRWVNVGGWWVEPDCNLPTGESFVRQGLYGQRYLRERFGAAATAGLNADPFGHNATIPQILRKQRMSAYAFLRPGPHEAELPGNPFWWESADGSRVLTYRIPHEYCSPRADIAHHTDKAVAQLPPGLGEAMVFYGVGNHGGGPTKANLASIRRLDDLGAYGSLVFGSLPEYFDAVLRSGVDLPVWRDDLQHHAAGCYSAHSTIKRTMRHTEHALIAAEKWASIASVVAGAAYPAAALEHAWKQVLFNQFHDILPGTSIEPAYEDARDQLGEARAIARRASNLAYQTIARDVDVPYQEGTQPILVFNPHPWPVAVDVECELGLFAEPAGVQDESGAALPVQKIQALATVNDARRHRIAFPAELPALGYRLYRAHPVEQWQTSPSSTSPTTLENDHLRVEVDPATGWLSSLVDKATGTDLVRGVTDPHTVVTEDPTDTWGHRVVTYAGRGLSFAPKTVRLVERGPVRSVLRVESIYASSTLVEELVLGRQARSLEVRVSLDWREPTKLVKLRIPTRLQDPEATYEIPYGHLVRPADGAEEPGQSWVDISGVLPDGATAGLTLINDSKAAYDVSGGDLGITVARSPVYAWHEPRDLDGDEAYEYQDQGKQTFRYQLLPHGGDWRAAGAPRAAAELAQPPAVMFESFHTGRLPALSSFVHAENDEESRGHTQITVLKQSEDSSDRLVVRGYETAGAPARLHARLPFLDRGFTAEFAPHEIKTLLVPKDGEQPIVEVDLLEDDA